MYQKYLCLMKKGRTYSATFSKYQTFSLILWAEAIAKEQREHVTVLDVRDSHEWQEGHIEGALHIPYHEIEQRLGELNPAQPLMVLCAGGQRSVVACALLLRHGFQHVCNVIGGMEPGGKRGCRRCGRLCQSWAKTTCATPTDRRARLF